ncbi:hypothetical protein AB5J72_49440 [Streptomyces sp. CG1]|uniref:hypothetical protein n=1 Tax=Streptomyces sp. CG1 TaxID=1287523 RepID=UPI0034E2BBCF
MPHVRIASAALCAHRSAQAGLRCDPANPLRYRRPDDAADAVAQAESLLAGAQVEGARRPVQERTGVH